MKKYVASTTLKEPEWNNSTLIEGDLAEFVQGLKSQPGEDILTWGSGRLLLQNGLLDLVHIAVHPIVAGTGRLIRWPL